MPWYLFQWTEAIVEHLAEHDIKPDDFEDVMLNPLSQVTSDSSGRPAVYGETADGRFVLAVYELLDDGITVIPVTCYEVPE